MLRELHQIPFRRVADDESGVEPPGWNGKTLLHVSVHRGWQQTSDGELNLNAGDTALNPLVRRLIDQAGGPFRWILKPVWEPLDGDAMAALQPQIDGIVIGGGGLFLRDQQGADPSRSGWSWNSSVDALDQIRVPVAVFAVGYNRFRGHAEFEPVFREHINRLAAKAQFFGLRNNGSIRALAGYIDDPATRARLRLQVCPTTLAWQLRPEFREMAVRHDAADRRVLALNCAFDRTERRFDGRDDEILGAIAAAARHAERGGWSIRVAAHKTLDRKLEPHLDAAGVTYDTYDLSAGSCDDVLGFYAQTDLTVGLRGHAQLIPFGLRRPIVSVVSHDKMRFFLDDIGHPEWGVDVREADFEPRLAALIEAAGRKLPETRRAVVEAQQRLFDLTGPNLADITAIFAGAGAT